MIGIRDRVLFVVIFSVVTLIMQIIRVEVLVHLEKRGSAFSEGGSRKDTYKRYLLIWAGAVVVAILIALVRK